MKPSWDNAPEWAQWLAMDDNGGWYWYEKKPHQLSCEWLRVADSKAECAFFKGWEDTLEKRA